MNLNYNWAKPLRQPHLAYLKEVGSFRHYRRIRQSANGWETAETDELRSKLSYSTGENVALSICDAALSAYLSTLPE